MAPEPYRAEAGPFNTSICSKLPVLMELKLKEAVGRPFTNSRVRLLMVLLSG
jgi:hypothetical protein